MKQKDDNIQLVKTQKCVLQNLARSVRANYFKQQEAKK